MPELMTVDEVADYLRVTKQTIYRLLWLGRIPASKVGHQWRFRKDSIDEWLRQEPVARKTCILVVDDDKGIRDLFADVLSELGHKVVTAKDGSEGLELMKQLDYDLVFVDLKLPIVHGAELFRRIRKIKPDLPVIIITGYPDSDMFAQTLVYGPFGVMRKPFDKSDIVEAVNTFVSTHNADIGNQSTAHRRKTKQQS